MAPFVPNRVAAPAMTGAMRTAIATDTGSKRQAMKNLLSAGFAEQMESNGSPGGRANSAAYGCEFGDFSGHGTRSADYETGVRA